MSTKGNIRIKKNEETPESPEILAASLIKIADSFEKLMGQKEGLTQDGIVALLFNMRGNTVGKVEIRVILENLKRLKSYYVRKSPSK